ncbi:MAG: hypothetical protein HY608_08670 [Planctomycetes bacterium]|nr:hypothetical protein [Planctomycetota bacterium]
MMRKIVGWTVGMGVVVVAASFGAEGDSPFHFHGYGEMHGHFPKEGVMDNRGQASELDFHRFVWGMGYEFSDTIRIDSEVDFEHAAGSMELEYALIEMDLTDNVSLRVGSLLMPVGPLNEFHEPPNFYSVNRPRTYVSLIPQTWQENGAGLAGSFLDGRLSFRTYVVAGLSIGANGKNFSTMDGVRGGRSKGNQGAADDLAAVGRIEVQVREGFRVGASGYVGEVDQDDVSKAAFRGNARLGIGTADVHWRRGNVEMEGVFVRLDLDEAEKISRLEGAPIGSVMQGGFVGAAYHYRPAWHEGWEFVPFTRWEKLDTNEDTPPGFNRDPEARRWAVVGGLAFYPHPQVVLKADVENWEDDASWNDSLQRFNLGAAWMY